MMNQYYFFDQYASSSSVDCTLSLGTPSTRMSSDHERSVPSSHHRSGRRSGGDGSSAAAMDPLFSRRCANCDTTSTPLWRNGPRGPKSLCNACGIRYKKEERRASAAASTGGGTAEHHQYEQHMHHNASWGHGRSDGAEYRFMDDVDSRDSFLSWRLNVSDRPGLVHDYTR